MSESAPLGRSAVPSLGQKRAVVSYSVPQCGQTLNTATGSSSAGVCCRASNPDPNPLSASARACASRVARSSSEALGGGERSSELSCSSADIDIEYACYPLARKVVPQIPRVTTLRVARLVGLSFKGTSVADGSLHTSVSAFFVNAGCDVRNPPSASIVPVRTTVQGAIDSEWDPDV